MQEHIWLADMFETAFGWVTIIHNNSGYLKKLTLPTGDKSKAERLIAGFPQKPFPLIESKLRKYFDGKQVDLKEVKIFEDSPPFYRRVYEELRKVPYGNVVSYSELASRAGSTRAAAQAVGGAMKRNQTPVVVPCHRVVKNDGAIGGFSADGENAIELKRKMLKLESGHFGSGRSRTTKLV